MPGATRQPRVQRVVRTCPDLPPWPRSNGHTSGPGSAPTEPDPDFGRKGNQRERVPEQERTFGGFVVEYDHSQQSPGPAAQRAEHGEKGFWHPLTGTGGLPLVQAERRECQRTGGGEPE